MNHATFDNVTRRASMFSLATPAASPLAASAKNTARKKLKRKQRQRCQAQVGPCETLFSASCAGEPECLATRPPCCAFLNTCDFAAFLTCLS